MSQLLLTPTSLRAPCIQSLRTQTKNASIRPSLSFSSRLYSYTRAGCVVRNLQPKVSNYSLRSTVGDWRAVVAVVGVWWGRRCYNHKAATRFSTSDPETLTPSDCTNRGSDSLFPANMDSAIDLTDANSALDLANIRYQLIRLEDTIIFHLIERVQFPYSPSVYKAGAVQIPNFNGSFLDWMLLQQEKVHAQVRRYQAPDEYPFFPDQLPEPFLAPLSYPKLLHPNNVNINEKIKDAYTKHILPSACIRAGPDRGEARENYGSTAVADVACLQAMSRRIHFGKFVAEAKFREDPEGFTKMIQEKDIKGLENAITKPAVELQVLKRLELKARTYGTDPSSPTDKLQHDCKINVEAVVAMYRDWVIPMTKEVEIDYLLQRLDPVPSSNGSAGKA